MKIKIEEFAKIKTALIDLEGISVIAGLNNTAKTTVGKILYAYIKTFNEISVKIEVLLNDRVRKIISDAYFRGESADYFGRLFSKEPTIESLFIDNRKINKADEKQVEELLIELQREMNGTVRNKGILKEIAKEIAQIYSLPKSEFEQTILLKNLNLEFSGQLNSLDTKEKGRCEIQIEDESFSVYTEIVENSVCKLVRKNKINKNAVFIGNPYVMDNGYQFDEIMNHDGDLYDLLSKEEGIIDSLLTRKKLNIIFNKMSEVVKGTIDTNYDGEDVYVEKSFQKPLKISNLSTGLKTFVILEKLLKNGSINKKTIVILDEPEIHLHPEWQIVYAELIVLLQAELGIKILLTTHSPYFLNALEVFSNKHKLNNINFYLSKPELEGIVFEKQNGDLENIYELLAKPFQKLENINYGDTNDK